MTDEGGYASVHPSSFIQFVPLHGSDAPALVARFALQ
jgi:hypothetical protein